MKWRKEYGLAHFHQRERGRGYLSRKSIQNWLSQKTPGEGWRGGEQDSYKKLRFVSGPFPSSKSPFSGASLQREPDSPNHGRGGGRSGGGRLLEVQYSTVFISYTRTHTTDSLGKSNTYVSQVRLKTESKLKTLHCWTSLCCHFTSRLCHFTILRKKLNFSTKTRTCCYFSFIMSHETHLHFHWKALKKHFNATKRLSTIDV